MKPGSIRILDRDRAYIEPGEVINEEGIQVSGGGYMVLYRGDLTEANENWMFKRCLKDAIGKIVCHGSDAALQVANQWLQILSGRTNKKYE